MAMNPKRKKSKRSKPRKAASHRRNNPNPAYRTKRRWSTKPKRRRNVIKVFNAKRRRRSNPAMFGNLRDLLVRSAYAIGGGITTRTAPEMLLGDRNVGFFGYVANGITAFATAGLVGKLTKSTMAAESWALGGIVMLTSRVIDDVFKNKLVTFAPATEIVQLSGDPAYRLSGEYIDQSFPVPYSSLPNAYVQPPALMAPEALAAAETNALAGDSTWEPPWN